MLSTATFLINYIVSFEVVYNEIETLCSKGVKRGKEVNWSQSRFWGALVGRKGNLHTAVLQSPVGVRVWALSGYVIRIICSLRMHS